MAKRKQNRRSGPVRAGGKAPGNKPADGVIWLYGTHAVLAAVANPARRLRRLVFSGPPPAFPAAPPVRPEAIPREEIGGLLPDGAVHQGIALLAEPLAAPGIDEFCRNLADGGRASVMVLDRVSDPQNVGAVLRSAAVFGADAVIVPERHAPPVTGALAKAASGALETVPLIRVTNLVRALEVLKSAEFWCAGLDTTAETTLAAAAFATRTALVLGAEGAGLRRLTRAHCDLMVRVPATGPFASLNVSAAAAVALYELARRD
jgi:23S rRNA (guanosine2251-2'-O)-methyltransferase